MDGKEFSLDVMAENLFNTITPGTLKMASGIFSGARRILLDYHKRLVIPKQYIGRKAVTWKFAQAGDAADEQVVLTAMTRKGKMADGFKSSFQRALTVAQETQLISQDNARALIEARI